MIMSLCVGPPLPPKYSDEKVGNTSADKTKDDDRSDDEEDEDDEDEEDDVRHRSSLYLFPHHATEA